jgi:subtilisin family serine protease
MSIRWFLAAWMIVAGSTTVAAQTAGKLDPLAQARLNDPSGYSRVIIRAQNPVSLGLVTTLIQQLGGTLGRPLPIIESVVATLPNIALTALAASPAVQRIALDRRTAGTLDRTGGTIGSTAVRQELGLDGSGIGVAVIDSGVTSWHDDLTGGPGPQRVDQFVDFVNDQSAAYDDYGHGTHVAGIIAGNGFDSNGGRAGVAPGARLVVLKVLDGSGRGHISDVIAALDYTVAHQAAFQIRVVNLSVAAGVYESCTTDLLTLAAKRAVEAGIVVVAAAGNAGRTPGGRTLYGGIGAPGNAPWVLTVGAASHQGTADRSDDIVAAFSSRGPTPIDRSAKPDLVAPGVGIESLSNPDSSLFSTKSASLLSGSIQTAYPPYLSLSGTSQAAPVVAGTVALMLQANPALTPNAVKAILQYTAQVHPNYDALTQGSGFVNARGAVELARYFAQPSTPQPSTEGWSRQIIWGTRRIRSGVLDLSANAWGTSVVWGSPTIPSGLKVVWGWICSLQAGCGLPGTWTPWRVSCANLMCSSYVWGDSSSDNVVWGTSCGGADCSNNSSWSTTGNTAVSTSDDGDTVVWGTSDDGDTVVWGTSDDGDTVVWGTSSSDYDIVWGTGGGPPPDEPWEDTRSQPLD